MSAGVPEVSAIILHSDDDVAVLLAPAGAGDVVVTVGARKGLVLHAAGAVPTWHKVALHDLPAGSEVRKYGEVIGRVEVSVTVGEHVHVHNLKSLRGH